MDILGFDKFWDYERQDDVPYMWAESNVHWYRNSQIARIKGGDLYTRPELQPIRDENGAVLFGAEGGYKLQPIDIPGMCALNEDLLTVIEDSTVKKIIREYEKFKSKLDIFHVAFSGGKDSAVLLDLMKKALPKDSFVVIFGDNLRYNMAWKKTKEKADTGQVLNLSVSVFCILGKVSIACAARDSSWRGSGKVLLRQLKVS